MGASAPTSSILIGPRTVLMVAVGGFPESAGTTIVRTTASYHAIVRGAGTAFFHLSHAGTVFPAARSSGSNGTASAASCARCADVTAALSRFHNAATY